MGDFGNPSYWVLMTSCYFLLFNRFSYDYDVIFRMSVTLPTSSSMTGIRILKVWSAI